MTTQETYCLNNKSLIPALNESEKFIKFLNEKFNLNLPNDFLINIQKAGKGKIGFFTPCNHADAFKTDDKGIKPLHSITLNTLFIKTANPYEVLTHELAHFINETKGIKDCSTNQYHNKHFKAVAEMLFLKVEKTKKGFSQTSETDEFNNMLKDFGTEKDVFNIFQQHEEKGKAGTRLYLWECAEKCFKIRCGNQELNASCDNCKTQFQKEEK